jgi:hypothetical protein
MEDTTNDDIQEKQWTVAGVIAENERRNTMLKCDYNPLTGLGSCGERVRREVQGEGTVWLPEPMVGNEPAEVFDDLHLYRLARIRYDFEYWCATCVTIKDKITSRDVKFALNAPQRRVLAELERQRLARQPIRLIMLKARQWGGSTLVQIYMAWIQIVHHRNWNSVICGHLRDTSSVIRGIYSKLLDNYPEEFLDGGTKMQFKIFEKSRNASVITGRECLVVTASAQSQDAIRGYDIEMAHLSEVAFWPDTNRHSPDDLVRAVCGSVALEPDTIVVYESTANGIGSFFHTEWLRAKAGLSDKTAVFVPWYEIEIYRRHVEDAVAVWNAMDSYERDLWEGGRTLEMISWYHEKRKEYLSHVLMKSEYPSNDIEAFATTGRGVFDVNALCRLRAGCVAPAVIGDVTAKYKSLDNVGFAESSQGLMKVWKQPDANAVRSRYVVCVDVGGRSDKSDYSVIVVIDRHVVGEKPEVVAQWRGHIDHDLLAWKAAQVAQYYRNALLVIESNTLETENTEGNGGDYILDVIGSHYRNQYMRAPYRAGFHTNRKTKEQALYCLIAMVRDGGYIERDDEAVNEMNWYELKPNGSYGAMKGRHDDILMTRCIALKIIGQLNEKRLRLHSTQPELFMDSAFQ